MRHASMEDGHPRPLYRSRDGAIFGVCKGVAEYMDVSLFWTRAIAIIGTMFTGVWMGVIAYFVAALLLKPEPVIPIESDDDREFYHAYTTSRSMALQRLKRLFDHLDRRIQRMEDTVTAREYDWERRLHE